MPLSRRTSLKRLAAATTLGLAPMLQAAPERPAHGRIKQSVVTWCFRPMPVPELAEHAATLGLASVELCDPEHWPRLRELGLTCAIAGSHGFAKGFAHPEEHEECLALLRRRIAQCAEFGVERVITFSGFRRGLSDEQAMANMVEGLQKIVPFAEEK